MVPFGPLAFMPGKLVHTNEVTVLLGDNWFAKCSAKQAVDIAKRRKTHVNKTLDDLSKVVKNFQSRVVFTDDLQKFADENGDLVDIREEFTSGNIETKGKHRKALRPHSKPKIKDEVTFENVDGESERKDALSEEELWARLDELEKQEAVMEELDRIHDTPTVNGEDISSDDEKSEKSSDTNGKHTSSNTSRTLVNVDAESSDIKLSSHINGTSQRESKDFDESRENIMPTIYFSHTVEPKRVRINTGKNTTLKFSEKKEEAKRKRKNSNGNGQSSPGLPTIKTPADIYRVFVDVVNGEYVPRKSILKSRSRDDSVCSDTSESSAADMDDRRSMLRSISHDDNALSDNSEGISEEDGFSARKPSAFTGTFEAFSGTVVEKEPLSPSLMPHLTIVQPGLPTIPEIKLEERKAEESSSQVSEETTKRVSKFKAARMQQKM
ncbi:unconventional prefoldin RPB5 interactor 1 isoform X2 [Protopterus annectens]|nr:unconventional prefoldin RPB5 interactor 1 isoform X2 [Protopterus annectens]